MSCIIASIYINVNKNTIEILLNSVFICKNIFTKLDNSDTLQPRRERFYIHTPFFNKIHSLSLSLTVLFHNFYI